MRLFSKRKQPEPVETPPEPVIGQPVRAIINAMRERPHTFGVKQVYTRSRLYTDQFVVRDRVTGLVVAVDCKWYPNTECRFDLPFPTSAAENLALAEAGEALSRAKYERLSAHKAARRQRKEADARREWCAKYNVRAES
ncbi:hypothetical protein [Marinobacter sp.]|uniref:hypothetical protein n=1 Tax=Marinobacter sp. TaxID=50741 RepID=UPI003A8DA1D7